MFSSLVKLFFGGEAQPDVPVDLAVDAVNAPEFGDSFLDADNISSLISEDADEDKENVQDLIDFETNEDDDWLLVNVSHGVNRIQSRRETCLSRLTESQPSSNSIMQWSLLYENTQEISPQAKQTQEDRSQSESEKNLNDSSASEPSAQTIRPRGAFQIPKWEDFLDAPLPVQKSPKEEEWERTSKDSAPRKIIYLKTINELLSYVSEHSTVISKKYDYLTPFEGTNTHIPDQKECAQCVTEPLHYHNATELCIWKCDSSSSSYRYNRFVPEKNKRRKHFRLVTSQSGRASVETTEVPQTFESHQPTLPSKADLLDYIKSVKPQQKAKELNIRKYLAPSQINRQNKVVLYEGKAKNNRRKDLWRCHSGANNNRKCC